MRNTAKKLTVVEKFRQRRAAVPIKRVITPPRELPAPVAKGYMDPEKLQELLPVSATKIITFHNEKDMQSYRQSLYKVNAKGDYRYRTLRDEMSMYGLVLWRMK